MNSPEKDRLVAWMPLLISLVLICGMVLGFNLRDSLRNKRDISTVITRNDRLEEIIDLINEKYVDTINSNSLYKNAVSGILKSLDPHTVYIPAEDLQSVNDELEGGFSGIGVEFSIVRDTIEVTSVVENGPAGSAGVQIGDQVIKVGDSLVAGRHISSRHIMSLLRGKQRSHVLVTLKRGNGTLKQLDITRDIIPVYSIDASLMLDAGTGYIKVNRFGATTYDEFKKALSKLQVKGAKQLIIDLRDNPGGYLEAATAMADDFLNDSKLIVYTRGLHTPKTEFKAGDKGLFEKGRLAILVDESSASASEILAGAMQDWDRGVIVGRRSFGKGLVQQQYEMPDGAALRLTIAKYYTPSGRCIQRSFENGKEAYLHDYERRFNSGELTGTDTTASPDTTKYYTSKHRVVYGGGGIKPDVYVPYDTARYSVALLSMIFSPELKTAIWDYFIRNRAGFKFRDVKDFDNSFTGTDAILQSYLSMLRHNEADSAQKELARPVAAGYFRQQIKAQIARFLYRDNGYYTISLKDDAVVNRALAIINSADYLKLISGK